MKRSRRQLLFLGPVAALAVACRGGAPDAFSPPPPASPTRPSLAIKTRSPAPVATVPSARATPAAAASLKIGMLLPYSEQALDADVGLAQRRAAELYLKQRHGMLGGRAASLIYSDESIDAKINQVKARQLLDRDRVDLLAGGVSTPTAIAMRDAAAAARVVYLDTNATGNVLTRPAPGCPSACSALTLFRTSASAWQVSEPLGEWVGQQGEKVFYVCHLDDDFGNESAAAFVEGLQRRGAREGGRRVVSAESADWTGIVAAIKAQPIKSVFGAFQTDNAVGFIKAWDQLGMAGAGYRLLGPGQLTDGRVLGETRQSALGIVTALFWSTELTNLENQTFIAGFRKEYRDEDTAEPVTPDVYALEMWDAMRALDLALRQVPGMPLDVAALTRALEAVSFKSPRGDFAFDPSTHNPVQNIYIREVRMVGGQAVNAVIHTIARVVDLH